MDNKVKSKYRDISIDILKFFAVLFVANSHMDAEYGKYSYLATCGAFGDALFFFCSGYTIFWGKSDNFFNWYKRRISRIYPTVFAWAFFYSAIGLLDSNMFVIIRSGAGKWFISCIMLYYAILWFVQKCAIKKISYVFIANLVFVLVMYLIFGFDKEHSVYKGTFKWFHYFLYMLMGAYLGLRQKNMIASGCESKRPKMMNTLILLFVSIVSFYFFCWFKKFDGFYDYLQLISLFPLASFCYYFWQLCNTEIFAKIYTSKYLGVAIKFISGLCLEIYIVQRAILTESLNFLFPLNLVLFFASFVLAGYLLRCLGRIWGQTFKDGDYDWKAVVKPY